MRLHIIRHGDPDYEHDTLTALGHIEATKLAQRLCCFPIKAIYTSPMGRAQETAGYTANKLGLPAVTLPWAGELQLRCEDKDAPLKHRALWNLPAAQLKKADDQEDFLEAFPHLLNRPAAEAQIEAARRGLDEFLAGFGMTRQDRQLLAGLPLPPHDIALFCHHGLGLYLLSMLMDVPPTVLWRTVWLPPTSVTTVVFEDLGQSRIQTRIVRMGDTAHLYGTDMDDYNTSGLIYNSR